MKGLRRSTSTNKMLATLLYAFSRSPYISSRVRPDCGRIDRWRLLSAAGRGQLVGSLGRAGLKPRACAAAAVEGAAGGRVPAARRVRREAELQGTAADAGDRAAGRPAGVWGARGRRG